MTTRVLDKICRVLEFIQKCDESLDWPSRRKNNKSPNTTMKHQDKMAGGVQERNAKVEAEASRLPLFSIAILPRARKCAKAFSGKFQ